MSCLRARVFGAYRDLLNAGYVAFPNDFRTFNEYRYAVRNEFKIQSDETDPEIVEKLLKRAYLVASEVRTQIVPVQASGGNRVRITFSDHHFEGQD